MILSHAMPPSSVAASVHRCHWVDECRKCFGKGLDTWYSAAYMSQTRYQQRFTMHASMPKEDILAFDVIQEYTKY